jgi:antitoxin component YwqK of YwqJK toxin-antitoxin module
MKKLTLQIICNLFFIICFSQNIPPKNGEWKEYYENGQLKIVGFYKDGKQEGEWKEYHENGQLKSVGSFKNGRQEGEWKAYDENGQLKVIIHYKNGEVVNE